MDAFVVSNQSLNPKNTPADHPQQQMLAQQGREILQAEANNARAQDEAAKAEHSRQEAEALRQQHEEQRRRQAEEAQRLQQQRNAAIVANLQGQRKSNWYTMDPTR